MERDELIEFIDNSNLIEDITDTDQIEHGIKAWKYLEKKKRLTLQVVLKVHKTLLEPLNTRIAGKLRMVNVYVGKRQCPDWTLVSGLLSEWLRKWGNIPQELWTNDKKAHVEFEHIHPFEDGNGRVGRLLWLWHREKVGLPFQLIEVENRQEYYQWFTEQKT